MPVVRAEKNSDFTVINNFYLRDKNISLKAKGLLSIILSLPDDWDYSVAGLAAICSEKETAVKSALKELKSYGYLVVVKKMPGETKSGRIEYNYIFCEQPQKQEDKKQGIEILPLEIQGIEIQEAENKTLEISHNKILIQNTDNKYISSETDDDTDSQLSLIENKSETGDKSQSDNTITVSVKEAAEDIYSAYPRKQGKEKGFKRIEQLLKGKRIDVLGMVKFNHEQLFCAVREYALECEENDKEKQFIKMFDTFMNSSAVEYVEKSAAGYEKYMERKYGSEWRSVKFVYK